MIPSHAALPLTDIEAASRCPFCKRVDPRCGASMRVGQFEIISCAMASERMPIVWHGSLPFAWHAGATGNG